MMFGRYSLRVRATLTLSRFPVELLSQFRWIMVMRCSTKRRSRAKRVPQHRVRRMKQRVSASLLERNPKFQGFQ